MKISKYKTYLAAPELWQAENGIIDVSTVQNDDDLLIIIKHYADETMLDKIVAYVGDIHSTDYYVEEYPPPQLILVRIPFTKIPNGKYDVIYTVYDGFNITPSNPTPVKIINSPALSKDIKLDWINPVYKKNADDTLHETLILKKGNELLSGNKITCVLKSDDTNVVFKDSNSQKWTTQTGSDGKVNISVISRSNDVAKFTIDAYLTYTPSIQASPLSAEFISSIKVGSISLESDYDRVSVDSFVTLTAKVTATGNIKKEGIEVFFSATNGATLNPSSGKINDKGEVTTQVTGNQIGTTTVTAIAMDKSEAVSIEYVNDYNAAVCITRYNSTDELSGNNNLPGDRFIFEIDSGFPTIGFPGAYFTLAPTGNPADNHMFDWSVNNSTCIEVNNEGQVTLIAPISGGNITAKRERRQDFNFSFKLEKWFVAHGDIFKPNFNPPSVKEVTSGGSILGPIQGVGTLLGEWGNMTYYPSWSGSSYFWIPTSTMSNDASVLVLNLTGGTATLDDAGKIYPPFDKVYLVSSTNSFPELN
ncbi:hypothetical protein ACP179_21250 [Xenorhabdus stockiae]|uniref:hypothetical protein n=1 Tax=Xenorhabdus stockiae TaxID=351614 RepID=UPI003CF67710